MKDQKENRKGKKSSIASIKKLDRKIQVSEEDQGELPLFTKQVISEVLSFSDIVIELDNELKIRRDSTRRTKVLKSKLRELAKETQKYNKEIDKIKLDS